MFNANGEPKDLDQLLERAKEEGPQTIITENVKAVAKEIDPENKLTGVALVQEVCAYVRTLLPRSEELQALYKASPELEYDKRSRSADELLSEENLMPNRRRARNISGCIETAIVTLALLRAKGIPCLYTETLQEEWCLKCGKDYVSRDPNRPEMVGHVFVDFYDEATETWYTADPNDGGRTIHVYGDYTKDGMQFIYPRSALDSWDLGYRDMDSFQNAVEGFFKGVQ